MQKPLKKLSRQERLAQIPRWLIPKSGPRYVYNLGPFRAEIHRDELALCWVWYVYEDKSPVTVGSSRTIQIAKWQARQHLESLIS